MLKISAFKNHAIITTWETLESLQHVLCNRALPSRHVLWVTRFIETILMPLVLVVVPALQRDLVMSKEVKQKWLKWRVKGNLPWTFRRYLSPTGTSYTHRKQEIETRKELPNNNYKMKIQDTKQQEHKRRANSWNNTERRTVCLQTIEDYLLKDTLHAKCRHHNYLIVSTSFIHFKDQNFTLSCFSKLLTGPAQSCEFITRNKMMALVKSYWMDHSLTLHERHRLCFINKIKTRWSEKSYIFRNDLSSI